MPAQTAFSLPSRRNHVLRWPAGQRKTVYLGMIVLGLCAFVMAVYGLKIWADYRGSTPERPCAFGDYFALWSYGRIVADHPATALYEPRTLHALQVGLGMRDLAQNPFPYPPVAILLFQPLALLPYDISYVVWTLATLALFVWAVAATCSRRVISVVGVMVAPVTVSCIDSGQTGLLAAALLIGGMRLAEADRRPVLGGVLAGLLAFKPQLALLVPIAFAAAGSWRALGAACATVIVCVAAATLAYGTATWTDWLAMLPGYSDAFDRDTIGIAFKPTVLSNLQRAGIDLSTAKAVQGIVAIAVAVLVWRCVRRHPGRLATAAVLVGTVLATPHAFIYDLPMVAAALVLVIEERLVVNPVFTLGEIIVLTVGFTFPLLMMIKSDLSALPISAIPLFLLFRLTLRGDRAVV